MWLEKSYVDLFKYNYYPHRNKAKKFFKKLADACYVYQGIIFIVSICDKNNEKNHETKERLEANSQTLQIYSNLQSILL